MNKTVISELEEAAAAQWGLFTIAQAALMGVSRQHVSQLSKSGRVERLSSGVYGFRGALQDPYAETKAAWLSTNPKLFAYERIASHEYDAVVTGATAAHLYEVGDLYPSPYTFSTVQRRQSQRDDIRYVRCAFATEDVTLVDGLPTARPAKVIADLVRVHEDPSLIQDVAIDFEQSGNVVDTRRLGQLLQEIRGTKPSLEEIFQGYERLPLMLARDEQGVAGLRLAALQEFLHQSTVLSEATEGLLSPLAASLQTLDLGEKIVDVATESPTLSMASEQATEPMIRASILDEARGIYPPISAVGKDLQQSLADLSASYDKLSQSNAALTETISEAAQALKTSMERQEDE